MIHKPFIKLHISISHRGVFSEQAIIKAAFVTCPGGV
jgi:hypothetical protein